VPAGAFHGVSAFPVQGVQVVRVMPQLELQPGAASVFGQVHAPLERYRGSSYKTLKEADETLVGRLVEGSLRHAERRREEMLAAAELLREVGVEPLVTEATARQLGRLTGLEPA